MRLARFPASRKGRVWAGLILILTMMPAAPAAPLLKTEVFEIHWRSVEDAAQFVRPLVSLDARIAIEPKLHLLTVTDRGRSRGTLRAAVGGFDRPPRAGSVSLLLLRASRKGGTRPVSEERRSIKDRVDPLQSFTDYKILGEATLEGTEGGNLSAALGKKGGYKVRFRIGAADERRGVVRFDDLTLEKRRGKDYRELMALTYRAKNGRKVVLGVTRRAEQDTGVLLVIRADIKPEAASDATLAGGDR